MMISNRIGNLPLALLQLLLVMVINPWGRVILGILVFSGGLVWGLFSHQVSYVQGGHGPYQAYLTEDNGFVIFQQDGTNNYYVMHIPDYSPAVDTATILSDMQPGTSINFIASTDSVRTGVTIRDTGIYVPTAHTIEKIVFYNVQQQQTLTYTNPEYSGNPNGYTINTWPYASLLMFAGALCSITSLFFAKRAQQRRKLAVAAHLAELEALPSPFARELAQ